jgi:hypothetical protein
MGRRSTIWKVVAGLYAVINVGGLAFAWAQEEGMHAMMHFVLILLGVAAYGGYLLARRGQPADHLPRAELAESRLEYLQQSVDAMALELERVGEAQRFNEKLRVEKGEPSPGRKDQ